VNTVSTMGSGKLGRKIDLEVLINDLSKSYSRGFEADFQNPSIATLRFEPGGPAITVYRTGSFQIRGTENPDRLFKVKSDFVDKLHQVGFETSNVSFEHQNTVFMENLNEEVNLETLAITLGLENVEYEPEQFPGLIFRPSELGTVVLVFASGKMIISGTTNEEAAIHSVEEVQTELR